MSQQCYKLVLGQRMTLWVRRCLTQVNAGAKMYKNTFHHFWKLECGRNVSKCDLFWKRRKNRTIKFRLHFSLSSSIATIYLHPRWAKKSNKVCCNSNTDYFWA